MRGHSPLSVWHKTTWRHPDRQAGLGLITMIGHLALLSIVLAVFSPLLVRVWDRHDREFELRKLQLIGGGIVTYLRQNKAFPSSLITLSPDYVAIPSAQISNNARGFPRYYAVHPAMAAFQNSAGLTAGELVNTRFLLISDLTQDASPTITTPAEFENWWTTDETSAPNLLIHRGNIGNLFQSLSITPLGNGASFSIHSQPTDSNGGLLPTHGGYHLTGTQIGFDEDNAYGLPEVQVTLTTDSAYWFDPNCSVGKKWNPLDPNCASLTVRDEFTLSAYSGNNGTQNWSNVWLETGESDGPSGGKIQVVNDLSCAAANCLRVGGGGGGPPTGLSREVDLSGATSGTLTFSYRRSVDQNGGSITLEISSNGGLSWTTLQTYTMDGSDASQVPQSFDITPYLAGNTQIKFQRSGNVKRFFHADNIQIAWN